MSNSAIQLRGGLWGLCGAAGAGKDTAADMMPGVKKMAFADAIYNEVAAAFHVTVADLKCRATKETHTEVLRVQNCTDEGFCDFVATQDHYRSRSPRTILQWWGDYRRAQDPDYFVNATRCAVLMLSVVHSGGFVLTDCRFANEVAMLRSLGGKLVQVERPGVAAGGTGHVSDTDGSEFAPDVVLHNNGGIDDLRRAVLALHSGCIQQ